MTRDEIPDPNRLAVKVWIDDVLVTEDSTANHEHHAPAIIAYVSSVLTLEPGDIISLGSAASQKTWPLYQMNLGQYGGPLRVEIEGLGVLENEITVAGQSTGFDKIRRPHPGPEPLRTAARGPPASGSSAFSPGVDRLPH